jgi:hypothetical protein
MTVHRPNLCPISTPTAHLPRGPLRHSSASIDAAITARQLGLVFAAPHPLIGRALARRAAASYAKRPTTLTRGESMTEDDLLRQIELQLNEFQADIQIVQIVLQHLMIASFHSSHDRQSKIDAIREVIQTTVEKIPNVSEETQDGERLKQLILARSDRFFVPVYKSLGLAFSKLKTDSLN